MAGDDALEAYGYVLDETVSPSEVADRIIADGWWTGNMTGALARLCYLDESVGDGVLVRIFPQLVSSAAAAPPREILEVYVRCSRYIR